MPQKPPEQPSLWIIAGANGSGKSTAYQRMLIEEPSGSVWIINPDLLTARIRAEEGVETNAANLQAVKRIESWLYASLKAYQTVGVETVLSTAKYRKLVRAAKHRGFHIRLIYVSLRSVGLNIERVRIRAEKGGHDVAAEKIQARRLRSFAELPWFLYHADTVDIYDNSGAAPKLVVQKTGDRFDVYGELTPELQNAVDRAVTGQVGA